MRIPLFHANAFTDGRFTGNPAAVCLLNSPLDDGQLRKVAAENNLSATAFLVPSGQDYELRWFTPRCEVKLCGHATLAAAYIVLQVLDPALETIRFHTRFQGALTVNRGSDGLRMNFPALIPKPLAKIPKTLYQALGQDVSVLEVAEVNQTYIARLGDEGAVRSLHPDLAVLEKLHPFVALVTARGENADFVSRYFAPGYGIPEDPVTGSAHCALAPYWAQRLGKSRLRARQLSERTGELWCGWEGDRVILEGKIQFTMQATLEIG
jgi:PhzF family phenazine biosynthesis protein